MTLEQVRDNIERDFFGLLLPDEIQETIQTIEDFKKKFHYLPNDIDEWYDNTIELIQQEDEIKEEYQAYIWEQCLKD